MSSNVILALIILSALTVLNIIAPMSGTATITPILAIITDPQRAVALAAFYFTLGGIIRVIFFRESIQWEYVKRLLPVSAVAALVGSLAIVQLNQQLLLIALIAVTLWYLFKRIHGDAEESLRSASKIGGYFTGSLSGFLQGTGILGGSDLRNSYLYGSGLSIIEVHGTTAIVGSTNFFIATVVRLLTQKASLPDITPLLLTVPFLVAGTLLGKKIAKRLSNKVENAIVILVMSAALLGLIYKLYSAGVAG